MLVMVDAHNLLEFGEYMDRLEESADYDEFLERLEETDVIAVPDKQRRYLRDMEDPTVFYTDVEFKLRYRFEKETVLAMLRDLHIVERLQQDRRQGLPLPPLIQLLCALQFYGSGSFQTVLGGFRKVHQSTVGRCLHRITKIIASQLGDFVKFPDEEGLLANQEAFYNDSHFPEVVGIIDGTHIPIHNPGANIGGIFRNRKRYYSVNVQVVCGPRFEILDVVARWPGSVHDARIFHNSGVRTIFETGRVQGCLIGDTAYPCTAYLLTPLLVTRTTAEHRYNVAHKHVQGKVECCIDVLKRRFVCLKKCLAYSPEKVSAFICACSVLHNIAVSAKDPVPDDGDIRDRVVPVQRVVQPQDSRGAEFRRGFIARHFE